MSKRLLAITALCIAAHVTPASADDVTGQELLNGFRELILTWTTILAFVTSAGGILLAAVSIWKAYNANEDAGRARHMGAALFAGVISITFVIIGWVSNALIPA